MTDYKSTIAELHYLADWAKHHLDKAKIANDAADAIESLQSKLGDAIRSLANWQHQCTELQAKVDAMGKGDAVALKPLIPCVCAGDGIARLYCKNKIRCTQIVAHGIHAKGGQHEDA
jgi:hypothetical protein